MKDFSEFPQQIADLIQMSKDYLRQQTIDPAKRLGRQAGMGIAGALLLSIGAVLALLGVYSLLRMVLPDSEWYVVLARFITAVVAAASAGLVAWRLSSDNI